MDFKKRETDFSFFIRHSGDLKGIQQFSEKHRSAVEFDTKFDREALVPALKSFFPERYDSQLSETIFDRLIRTKTEALSPGFVRQGQAVTVHKRTQNQNFEVSYFWVERKVLFCKTAGP